MRKGEIWLINLDPTVGAEIRKTRPAVIVSEDAIGVLPLRVIVPLTDWKERTGRAFGYSLCAPSRLAIASKSAFSWVRMTCIQ